MVNVCIRMFTIQLDVASDDESFEWFPIPDTFLSNFVGNVTDFLRCIKSERECRDDWKTHEVNVPVETVRVMSRVMSPSDLSPENSVHELVQRKS